LVVGLDHVPVPADQKEMRPVRDRKERFQAPQLAVRPPLLRELDAGPRQVAGVALELLLELLEKRERVRDRAGESRQYPALLESPDLLRRRLDDRITERDLPITTQCNPAVV